MVFQRWRTRRLDQAQRRWSVPPHNLARRVRAWFSLLVLDHGFLRPVYWNSAPVDKQMWRGAQPNPFHLRRLKTMGLRSVVNLRGSTVYGSYALEKEASETLGLAHHDVRLYSGAAPLKEQIHALHRLFQTLDYPALLHCKSGADRTGLAAALYLILMKNVPAHEAAASQLRAGFGHIKTSKTGILDAFFERYACDTATTPMAFLQWVDEVYDPGVLNRSFAVPSLKQRLWDVVTRRE